MTDERERDRESTGAARPAGAPTEQVPAGSPRSDRLLGLLALVAVLPLVVDVSERSLPITQLVTGLGEQDVAGSRLHVVLPLIAILAVLACLRRTPSLMRPLPIVVILMIVQFTLAIGWGLAHGAGLIGFLFYVQTVVPLVAWLAAYRIAPQPRTLARAVMVGVLFTAVVALVFTVFHGGIDNAYSSSVALEDPIPQYRSYYPALMALGTAVGVASIRHDRWLSVATIASCLVLLPITWSRAGILMVMVAFSATVFFCHLRGRRWWAYLLAGGVTAAGFAVIGKIAMTIGLWNQRVVGSDLAESDSARVDLAQESTQRMASSPLFGDAFRPHSDQLLGGGVATFDRLFPTHNQYLDYGVRGGAIAAILLVAFLALTTLVLLWRWWISSRQDFEPMYGAGLGLLAALVPAALTELYISQTWSGVVLMLFLGSLAHMVETRRSGHRSSSGGAWLRSLTRRR